MLKGLLENMRLGFLGENIKKFKKISLAPFYVGTPSLVWHPITLLLTHLVSYHR
jgi:hypothetical protein